MNSWYPRYPGDYRRKTAHLSLAQHGAYCLCLDHYYSTGRQLPADREAIYRICGALNESERAAVDSVVAEFFAPRADGYHNDRADLEIARREEKRKKLSEAGRLGAEATHRKDGKCHGECQNEKVADALARPQPHPQPQSEPEKTHTVSVSAELVSFWNANRGSLPEVLKVTRSRLEKIRSRIEAESNFAETFKRAVLKVVETPFCCGAGDRGWKATLDWLVANDTNCIGVLEGKYDSLKGDSGHVQELERRNLAAAGFTN
jgi:uncharacterized protein YdaU (DUF1376 family)